MSSSSPGLHLRLFAESYSVMRLPSATELPKLLQLCDAALGAPETLLSVTRVGEELSVVAPQEVVQAALAREAAAEARVEPGWRVLEVAGPLDFSLTGVLASLVGPLARAKVSVFTLSTFDTDYLLVKQTALGKARQVLEGAGHRIDTE